MLQDKSFNCQGVLRKKGVIILEGAFKVFVLEMTAGVFRLAVMVIVIFFEIRQVSREINLFQ